MKNRRILSLVLALVMVLGAFGSVFAAEEAKAEEPAKVEAEEAKAEEAKAEEAEEAKEEAEEAKEEMKEEEKLSEKVQWLVNQGLIKGTDKGLELEKGLTRAETARVIALALGQEDMAMNMAGSVTGYADVPADHWAAGYINLAKGEHYMVGYEDNTFRPNEKITYAELIKVLTVIANGEDIADSQRVKGRAWYTPYMALAAKLNVTEGVEGYAAHEDAVREKAFEMLYNVLHSTKKARYNVYKGIVIENARVARLGDDEVKFEVISVVEEANRVEESRIKKGSRMTINVKDIASAEDLLGRVADFTFDKDGKLVDVVNDETYKIVEGNFKASYDRLGSYRVAFDEKYYTGTNDRSIFRTYYNNRDLTWEDYYTNPTTEAKEKSFQADYVRATIKDGRVLFVNAFNFEEINPVKEVAKEGAEVFAYNDARDGLVKKYNFSAGQSFIFVKDGVLTRGDRSEINVDNVIHEYKGGFIIKQDAPIVGKYERVSRNVDRQYFVHIEEKEGKGNSFYIRDKELFRPVYQYEITKDFYTLFDSKAANNLANFRGKEVRVLTDVSGALQYIGSDIDYGDYIAVVTRIIGHELRVHDKANETHDLRGNLDTIVKGRNHRATTGHQNLNVIDEYSAVYVRTGEDNVAQKVIDLSNLSSDLRFSKNFRFISEAKVEKDGRELKGYRDLRLLPETSYFYVNAKTGKVISMTKDEAVNAYKATMKANKDVKGYLIDSKTFHDETIRQDRGRSTEAYSVIFTDINIPVATDTKYVQVIEFYDYRVAKVTVRFADGTEETYPVYGEDAVRAKKADRRDVYAMAITKGDNPEIYSLNLALAHNDLSKVVTIKDGRDYRDYYLAIEEAPKDLFIDYAEIFDNPSYKTGEKLVVLRDADDARYAVVILPFDGALAQEATGMITHINKTAGEESFTVDKKTVYFLNDKTILRDKDGKALAHGVKEVTAKTKYYHEGAQVDVKIDGDIMTITVLYTKTELDTIAARKAKEEEIENFALTAEEKKDMTAESIKLAEEEIAEIKEEARKSLKEAKTLEDIEKIVLDKKPATDLLVTKLDQAKKDKLAEIEAVVITDAEKEGKTAESIELAENKLKDLKDKAKAEVNAAKTLEEVKAVKVDKAPALELLEDEVVGA